MLRLLFRAESGRKATNAAFARHSRTNAVNEPFIYEPTNDLARAMDSKSMNGSGS